MKNAKTIIFGMTLSLIIIVAFFLPWARPLGEVESVQRALKSEEWLGKKTPKFLIWDYVMYMLTDWQDFFGLSDKSVSAFQMVFVKKNETANEVRRTIARHFIGHEAFERILQVSMVVISLLAIVSLFVSIFPNPHPHPKLKAALGVILALIYLLIRFNVSETKLVEVELAFGAGFIIVLYGTLLLGIFCLIRSVPIILSGK